MKKIVALLLALTLAFSLASCKKKPVQQPENVQNVAGTVTDATMSALSLETAAGSVYRFDTEGAKIDSTDGILVDDVVIVYFTGTLEATQDVQPVTVTEIAVVDGRELGVEGAVTAVSAEELTVKTQQGESYSFKIKGVHVESSNNDGLLVGDLVIVYYTGVLADIASGTQDVTVTRVTITQEPQDSVDGVVTDASLSTLEIKTAGNVNYLFTTTGADIKPGPNGLIVGDTVTVYFAGVLDRNQEQQSVLVEHIVVTMEPQPDKPQPPASTKPHTATEPGPADQPATPDPVTETEPGPAEQPAAPDPVTETEPGPAAQPAAPFVPPLVTVPPVPDHTEHSISGTVSSISGDEVALSASGQNYTFNISGVSIDDQTKGHPGFIVGDDICVFYTGALSGSGVESVEVTRLALTGWGGGQVNGLVLDIDPAAFQIKANDGTVYIFDLTNLDVERDGGGSPALNDRAYVFYTGTLAHGQNDQSGVNVIRVLLYHA